MPSSIDMPFGEAADYAADPAVHGPLSFRRRRFWFIEFVMTPFKDTDARAIEDTAPRKPPKRRRG